MSLNLKYIVTLLDCTFSHGIHVRSHLKVFEIVAYDLVTADEWIPATEALTDRPSLIIRNLTTGDKLQFRVRAYNMAGPSAPAMLAEPVTIREIMREYF